MIAAAIVTVLAACGGQGEMPEYAQSVQPQANAAQNEGGQTQAQETKGNWMTGGERNHLLPWEKRTR